MLKIPLPTLEDDMPGYDWLSSFMKRYRLSYKLPSNLEKSRKAASADPNIIYGFYDLLESTVAQLGILERPECLWNVDETNLYIEAQNSKVS